MGSHMHPVVLTGEQPAGIRRGNVETSQMMAVVQAAMVHGDNLQN